MAPLHLEDLEVGRRFTSGSLSVTAAGIKAFAAEFDPQPFHLDEAKAKHPHPGVGPPASALLAELTRRGGAADTRPPAGVDAAPLYVKPLIVHQLKVEYPCHRPYNQFPSFIGETDAFGQRGATSWHSGAGHEK